MLWHLIPRCQRWEGGWTFQAYQSLHWWSSKEEKWNTNQAAQSQGSPTVWMHFWWFFLLHCQFFYLPCQVKPKFKCWAVAWTQGTMKPLWVCGEKLWELNSMLAQFQVLSGNQEWAVRHEKMCCFSRYNIHLREYHITHSTVRMTFTVRLAQWHIFS